jgi:leucyl-tRNA synthetase
MNKLSSYNHKEIEPKWQKVWAKDKTYSPDIKKAQKPFYNLMMFPYPSAEGLHVGNMYAFTGADVFGRYKRMNGYDVLEPIGLDGFGIHSENYAIKVGRHPNQHAEISENNFYNQLHMIGNGYDWLRKLETYDPSYYKWTQWLFVQMFKAGLAYKGNAQVNWCPSCKTVLADEQVNDAKCERCGTEVERREMSSWYFKITEYADRLLANIDTIDWPAKIKIAQRQWIGKSKGLSIDFEVDGVKKPLTVWTKFWETIHGVTFIVVSPEYAKENLMDKVNDKYANDVIAYIKVSLNKSDQERKAIKEKTGIPTGIYAKIPVNGQEVPIYVADYVLAEVGTGAVMGVPAHDERDFDFVKKYNLPVIQVVSYTDKALDKEVSAGKISHEGYDGDEVLINSGDFNGLNASKEGKEKMAQWMISEGFARWETNYHLRDWLISRQRYWGPPIPMINCKDCGWQPVPEDDLPVVLPDIKDFKPQGDGTSPLHNAPESWKKVKCPNCGKTADRELDVSDTFLDSSWYFLRYPSIDSESSTTLPFDVEITKKWLPVNAYIGGAEHAVLHLLYSRFVTMFLNDKGYLDFEEPFPYFFGHGLIIKDGAKMSKSKGNVVNPDTYIEKFGADTLRAYLMFLGPFDEGGDFRDTGIEGMGRFLGRVWRLFDNLEGEGADLAPETMALMHKTIRSAGLDISNFKYNTAISRIMEYVNYLTDKKVYQKQALGTLLQLLAPFAPHMTEELWREKLGNKSSIHTSVWPKYDEKYLVSDETKIIVQVNGKLRGTLEVDSSSAKDKVKLVSEAKGTTKSPNGWRVK